MAGNGGMYQNKYEAMLEKKNAERMILDKDYAGARDKLRKAHSLFPIDNIVSMITVCDVLSASTHCYPAVDIDYYWILRLTPISTVSDVRLSYRKLTSLLRPLTHIFPGTELALKLIQDAFTVLSDNDSRSQFDLHRNKVWTGFQLNGFNGLVSDLDSEMDIEPSDDVPFEKTRHMQELSSHEATRKNSKGKEIESSSYANTAKLHRHINLEQQSSSYLGGSDHGMLNQDFYNFDDERIVNNLKPGQIWATRHQSPGPLNFRYAQIIANDMSTVSIIWLKPIPVGDEERNWCEAGLPVACGSFCIDLEIGEQRVISPSIFSHESSWSTGLTVDQFEIYPKKGEVWALFKDWNMEEWPSDPDTDKICQYSMVEIISDFSKYTGVDCACLMKVHGFNTIFERKNKGENPVILHISPSMLYMFSHNVLIYRLSGIEKNGLNSGMLELEHSALSDYIITKKQPEHNLPKMDDLEHTFFNEVDEISPQTTYLSEKEVLEDNQSLKFAAAGQLWAIYSGRYSMPRQYVIIEDIIEKTHARVTFLEHEPVSKSEMNWKKKNVTISCGFYIVGGTTVIIEMSQISHPIRCQKTMSGYMIYPMKGEVWAMYQDWNSNWERSSYESCEYSIIEVVSDLSEGDRIVVARLAKVVGCLTFYVKTELNGYELTREIPRKDILSFSHQIPCFKVPGIGLYGIPESCWHLEPSALPPKRRKSISAVS